MSHFANIDHFSEHPCLGDDSFSCSSGADYRHSNSAYYHPEADSASSRYSISSWAPCSYLLRAHRAITGPSFRRAGFALWGADYRRCRDIHLSHHLHIIILPLFDHLHNFLYVFSYYSSTCNPMLLICYILGLIVLLVSYILYFHEVIQIYQFFSTLSIILF